MDSSLNFPRNAVLLRTQACLTYGFKCYHVEPDHYDRPINEIFQGFINIVILIIKIVYAKIMAVLYRFILQLNRHYPIIDKISQYAFATVLVSMSRTAIRPLSSCLFIKSTFRYLLFSKERSK